MDRLSSRSPRSARPAALAVALVGLLAACGDDGPLSPAATPPVDSSAPAPVGSAPSAPPSSPAPSGEGAATPATAEVVAIDNTFRPNSLTVAVGTEVRFVNRGRNEHDALSVEGDTWGVESVDFGPGDEYVHVFDEPGTYRYYCSLHGTADVGMVGEIVVEEASP